MIRDGRILLDLISDKTNSDDPALLSLESRPATYRDLYTSVVQNSARLFHAGIRKRDRVALVSTNGPEAVAGFLTVSSVCACAPLNPTYSAEEFKFYLTDLKTKAVIIAEGMKTCAHDAAEELGIPVFALTTELEEHAGSFSLSPQHESQEDPILPSPDDVALVLHTSGTTGRPKIVPLTHNDLYLSARNIAASLSLTAEDRCLNPMPLFHVHGLLGAVLSTFASGGSVVCAPRFDSSSFFGWLHKFSPTWYTAVPTIHQSVLAEWSKNHSKKSYEGLRFIRSCSSPLAPAIGQELEGLFSVPVVEAYGMTEASHQIACNPLRPGARKWGSVGLPTGTRVSIMDAAGNILEQGLTGEIVIQGPSVISSYEGNPTANASSFVDGWFRTGDQGYLDEDGYVFITGRIKEMINRGGEKLSPREIDEVLLKHPAIQQAAAFAIPHPTLGEDVGAIVVLRNGMTAAEKEVRQFVAERLTYFKVPSRIVFAGEIPKGPTGKVQRVGLAEKLGITAVRESVAAQASNRTLTPDEQIIADIWREVLEYEVSIDDDFFTIGGSSLQAMQIIGRIHKQTGVNLQFAEFFDAPTITEMAELVSSRTR